MQPLAIFVNWPPTWWLIWLAFILAAAFSQSVWAWLMDTVASDWPVVPGKVLVGRIEETKGAKGQRYYRAELPYIYDIAGTTFSGAYKRAFGHEDDATQLVQRLEYSAISVDVRPNHPATSRLLAADVQRAFESHPPVPLPPPEPPSLSLHPSLRPLLLVGLAASCLGLSMSVWVHLNALFGRVVLSQEWFAILHVGIFVLWFPGIFLLTRVRGSKSLRDLRSIPGIPAWLGSALLALFAYMMINFALFYFQESPSKGLPDAGEWRGFSGHWMLFYAVGAAMYLGAYRLSEKKAESLPPDASPAKRDDRT